MAGLRTPRPASSNTFCHIGGGEFRLEDAELADVDADQGRALEQGEARLELRHPGRKSNDQMASVPAETTEGGLGRLAPDRVEDDVDGLAVIGGSYLIAPVRRPGRDRSIRSASHGQTALLGRRGGGDDPGAEVSANLHGGVARRPARAQDKQGLASL